MEASEEGHFDVDLTTDEIFVSARLNEIYGFARQAETANRVEYIKRVPCHPDDLHLVADVSSSDWEDSVRVRRLEKYSLRIVPRPGETRWIQIQAMVKRDAQGRARRRVGKVTDIEHISGDSPATLVTMSISGNGLPIHADATTNIRPRLFLEGNYYVNPYAISDIVSAMSAGLYATVYHFAIPNITTGAAQAQFALKYSKYRSGGRALPLMLDIEYDPYVSTDHTNECYGLSAAAMRTWISSFVSTARSATGQYPIIYTTANWWDTCTGSSTAFGADPMWVAAYGVSSPPMPAGWPAYTFWQYSSSGTVSGVSTSGGTDLSYFNPSVVGLIDPGSQASKGGAKVGMQVASLDAVARATLKFTASGLPPGLSITAAGDVTGTIKKGTAGAVKKYLVTVTAKNAKGASGSAIFNWQVTG